MIGTKGDLAVVRRKTTAASTAGAGRVRTTFATVGPAGGVTVSFHDTGGSVASQQFWGVELRLDLEAYVAAGVDVQEDDGLQIQNGDHAGRFVKVVGRRRARFAAAWQRLALQWTTEAFA